MLAPKMLKSNFVDKIRGDFPILKEKVYGLPLVYLDNAATTQKPKCVIDCIAEYYSTYNSNVHRGVYKLSEQATKAYELVRSKIKAFINSPRAENIVFTSGTTESVNLVAYGLRAKVKPGEQIIVSGMEHHSNIVPWQILCKETGAKLKVIPFSNDGVLDLDQLKNLLKEKTALVAVTHLANAIGTINPIREIARLAHSSSALILVDGAQAAAHLKVDVQELDVDFYCFSSHKLYGPTGVGALYAKTEQMQQLSPYQTGGEMIFSVSFEETTYKDAPHKFEAGTPNISGVIGFGRALDYVTEIGLENIAEHEANLLNYARSELKKIPELRILAGASPNACLISFILTGIHAHDIGTILDRDGIAIRTGHHCAQPLMDYYKIPASARVSFAMYNTIEEVDILCAGLKRVRELLK